MRRGEGAKSAQRHSSMGMIPGGMEEGCVRVEGWGALGGLEGGRGGGHVNVEAIKIKSGSN